VLPELDSRHFHALLAAIVVLGGVLRVIAATHGFVGDELFTWVIASGHSLGDVMHGVRTTENTPPLYYLLAWASFKATGVPELIRLPSLVGGIATIPVAALVGRRAFGAAAGLAAAALIAASPFAIYYSSEARAYAPAAFCVLASTLLLLRALDRPRLSSWAGFALLASAAVWFHYTAIFPLAAQASKPQAVSLTFTGRPDPARQPARHRPCPSRRRRPLRALAAVRRRVRGSIAHKRAGADFC